MNTINASFRASNGAMRHRVATAESPTPVFRCFVWLDLILPWVIVAWLLLRSW